MEDDMRVIPYLTFGGRGEEALNHYKKVLDGEISNLMRYDDMPTDPQMPVSESWKKKIMHGELKFGDDLWLYASDGMEGHKVGFGESVTVHIDVDSEETLQKYFDGLSDGGTVTMPVEKMFWGAVYGSVTDKFGINWGFNYQIEE
jgi:PhnB protein